MLEELQWPTLDSRLLQSHLALMYRIRHDLWTSGGVNTSLKHHHIPEDMDPASYTELQCSGICLILLPPHLQGLEPPGKEPCHFILPRRLQNRIAGASKVILHLAFISTRTCMYSICTIWLYQRCSTPAHNRSAVIFILMKPHLYGRKEGR